MSNKLLSSQVPSGATTPANRAVIAKLLPLIAGSDRFGYLCGRWADESKYEDINEYGAFGFEFTADGTQQFAMLVKRKSVICVRRPDAKRAA